MKSPFYRSQTDSCYRNGHKKSKIWLLNSNYADEYCGCESWVSVPLFVAVLLVTNYSLFIVLTLDVVHKRWKFYETHHNASLEGQVHPMKTNRGIYNEKPQWGRYSSHLRLWEMCTKNKLVIFVRIKKNVGNRYFLVS
jgi:hypothetical protein